MSRYSKNTSLAKVIALVDNKKTGRVEPAPCIIVQEASPERQIHGKIVGFQAAGPSKIPQNLSKSLRPQSNRSSRLPLPPSQVRNRLSLLKPTVSSSHKPPSSSRPTMIGLSSSRRSPYIPPTPITSKGYPGTTRPLPDVFEAMQTRNEDDITDDSLEISESFEELERRLAIDHHRVRLERQEALSPSRIRFPSYLKTDHIERHEGSSAEDSLEISDSFEELEKKLAHENVRTAHKSSNPEEKLKETFINQLCTIMNKKR